MAHEHGGQQSQPPTQSEHRAPGGINESAQADHAAIGHGDMGHAMTSSVTGPQLTAVAILTVLALVGAFVFGIARYNLTLSNHDVGGLVMAPGMIMDRETTAEAMRDMAAASPWDVTYVASPDERGDRPLDARIENGVKVYDLDTSVIRWNILHDAQVTAYAFNKQVPGPRIRITEGDREHELAEAGRHRHGCCTTDG